MSILHSVSKILYKHTSFEYILISLTLVLLFYLYNILNPTEHGYQEQEMIKQLLLWVEWFFCCKSFLCIQYSSVIEFKYFIISHFEHLALFLWNKWIHLVSGRTRAVKVSSETLRRHSNPPWPSVDDPCVKMPDTSSEVLCKYNSYITARFQIVTPQAVIVDTTACVNDESLQRGPSHPRRCPRVRGEWGNTEDKPNQCLYLSLYSKFIVVLFH